MGVLTIHRGNQMLLVGTEDTNYVEVERNDRHYASTIEVELQSTLVLNQLVPGNQTPMPFAELSWL
jgi:hypothetical protein